MLPKRPVDLPRQMGAQPREPAENAHWFEREVGPLAGPLGENSVDVIHAPNRGPDYLDVKMKGVILTSR